MLMPLHYSMPSFMNFRRFLDLLEFKNPVSQWLRASDGGKVCEIPSHFLHGSKACNQGHIFDFSTSLYALENVHVVEICIMRIKCLENPINVYKCPNEPWKNSKIEHNTPVVLSWHSKISESNKRQRISFRPQRWHLPYQNHHHCCEKLCFVRSLYPNLPQMGQKLYHGMLMPLHDSAKFHEFQTSFGLVEFKN